jgi:hypothetical protein
VREHHRIYSYLDKILMLSPVDPGMDPKASSSEEQKRHAQFQADVSGNKDAQVSPHGP